MSRVLSAVAAVLIAPLAAVDVCEAPLDPGGLAAGDQLGYAVAADGDTIVVGLRSDDDKGSQSGSAIVLVRSGTSWAQQQKLVASDGAGGDFFGAAVAIDGDTIVVGAPSGYFGAGAAYVFERSGTTWTETAALVPSVPSSFGSFGAALDVEADTVAVGAPHVVGPAKGDAYVFVRAGATWVLEQRVQAADVAAEDLFGSSVSVSGDLLAVGASKEDGAAQDAGAAYVFARAAGAWSELIKLLPAGGAGLDRFGVALSLSGDTLAMGGWGADPGGVSGAGAVQIFRDPGTGWAHQLTITPPAPVAGGFFGGSIHLDGGALLVGSSGADRADLYSGAGASWTPVDLLLRASGAAGDSTGYSVGLSGSLAVVGTPYGSTGGVAGGAASAFALELGSTLFGCPTEISLSAGGTQALSLAAGIAHAGELHFLLGSASGTSPGVPYEGHVLPLNIDTYFLHTLANPHGPALSGGFGVLDAAGEAAAQFIAPAGSPPGLAGLALHHAYGVLDPLTGALTMTSGAVPLDLAL